jgi:hypothetical protein
MKYHKTVYQNIVEPTEQYQLNIITNQDDIAIWDDIFRASYTTLNYFIKLNMHLTPQNQPVQWEGNDERYESELSLSQLADVYKTKTFQDYVDSMINIQTIGSADYQTFVVSMENPNFRYKLVNKYHSYVREQQIKNHLIYIIQSHINHRIDLMDKNIVLDIIPYFEYLGMNGLSLDNVDDYSEDNQHNYVEPEDIRVHILERETLRIIKRTLLD